VSYCAGAPPPAKPNTEAQRELDQAIVENDRLYAEVAQMAAEDYERCEMLAGDCRMEVSEQRDALLEGQVIFRCRGKDHRITMRCMRDELVERGKVEELAAYYSFDNFCVKKLLDCKVELDKDARVRAKQAEYERRKRELESSESGIAARATASATAEHAAYARLTCLPAVQAKCKDLPGVEECLDQVPAKVQLVEDELAKDEDYSPERALELYRAAKSAEAACAAIEFSCYGKASGPEHGETEATKRVMQQNYTLITRREKLAAMAPADAVDHCVNVSVKGHRENIVGAYVTYIQQPVMFFRNQMLKAFVAMHEAQVSCLERKVNAGKK
jgi:hypothetical protein